MKAVLRLAALSAWSRRLTLGLTLVAIALAVTLLLAVERLRVDARQARLDAEERGWPLVLDGLLDRYQELLLPPAGAESQIATTTTASASGALLAKPLATRPPGAHAA